MKKTEKRNKKMEMGNADDKDKGKEKIKKRNNDTEIE